MRNIIKIENKNILYSKLLNMGPDITWKRSRYQWVQASLGLFLFHHYRWLIGAVYDRAGLEVPDVLLGLEECSFGVFRVFGQQSGRVPDAAWDGGIVHNRAGVHWGGDMAGHGLGGFEIAFGGVKVLWHVSHLVDLVDGLVRLDRWVQPVFLGLLLVLLHIIAQRRRALVVRTAFVQFLAVKTAAVGLVIRVPQKLFGRSDVFQRLFLLFFYPVVYAAV